MKTIHKKITTLTNKNNEYNKNEIVMIIDSPTLSR